MRRIKQRGPKESRIESDEVDCPICGDNRTCPGEHLLREVLPSDPRREEALNASVAVLKAERDELAEQCTGYLVTIAQYRAKEIRLVASIATLETELTYRVDPLYAHCDVEACCARWTVARCDEHRA